MGHIRSGKLRALAVTSVKRFALTLDLPTASESGLPGFKTSAWQGFPAPAATPRQIIQKLNGETVSMLAQPSMRERLSQMGAEAVGNSPEAF